MNINMSALKGKMKLNQSAATKAKAPVDKAGESSSANDKVSLSYFPQCPDVLPEAVKEFEGKITAGPTDSRLRVSVPRNFPTAAPDAEGNFLFTPDDPNFDSVNTFAVARQTLEIAQKYSDREIPWSFSSELGRDQMLIHPHAGKGTANAFYSSEAGSVNFFSYVGEDRNIYRTGLQSDVIAHEVGHAVLDALRPSYIRSFSVPAGGYHESFGDMLSLLRALHEPKVVDQLKTETQGDLSKPNIASRLAEQLGQTLVGTPSLRDAINDHKFADQHFLTYLGDQQRDGANSFGTEPHAYANLFTGAFYDIFQAVYEKAAANPDATFHQAVASARDTMGHLLFRATELGPVGNPAYPEMAQAFLQADIIENGGENLGEIASVFSSRNILNQRQLEQAADKLNDVPNVRLRKAALKAEGAHEFLADKAEELGLPKNLEFEFQNAYQNKKGETYINFSSKRLGDLDDPDFGVNEGSKYEGVGGLTLLFGSNGKLMAKNHDEITDREMSDIKNFIRERSIAEQFVAFSGVHASHADISGHDHKNCNHAHSHQLMFNVRNDGSGPVLVKAPVVFC